MYFSLGPCCKVVFIFAKVCRKAGISQANQVSVYIWIQSYCGSFAIIKRKDLGIEVLTIL